jgi:protein-arginine kinase
MYGYDKDKGFFTTGKKNMTIGIIQKSLIHVAIAGIRRFVRTYL